MFKLFIKKWLFLLILIVSNLIIGIRISLLFFHFLFWFLSVFLIISLLWIIISYFGTKIVLTRKILERVDEDSSLDIETVIKNTGILPVFNLVLEDNLACAGDGQKRKLLLIEFLGQKASVNLKYGCICPLRGKYSLGPFTVYFFDPLGLLFFKKTYYVYSQLYVYPRAFHIRRFPELKKGVLPWFGIETARVSGDEDEFFGTREYKEGDPIKRIHWISSARKNKLIVKQFQRQSFFRATIMFNLEKDRDFGEGKEKVSEYIIKIAASVASYLIDKGISLEIIAHSEEIVNIPFNKGQEHLEDILKFLAVARAESRVNLGEMFEEFYPYVRDDSTLIAIMSDTEQEFLASMLALKERGVSLIPLIIKSSTFIHPFEGAGSGKEGEGISSYVFNLNPILFSRGENLEGAFV